MAMQTNDIIVISDVVNYVNSYLKTKIESSIQYYKENPPPNFDTNNLSYFSSGNKLPSMKIPSVKGKQINIQDLYNRINSIFVSWGMVRKVTFHYRDAGYSNGGAIPWYDHYYTGYGYLSFISPDNVKAIMDNEAKIQGEIIRPLSLKNVCDTLYNKWLSWGSTFGYVPYRAVCHHHCHSSCHGSGGRR